MRRRGLKKLLTLAKRGTISTLIITHKDRLAMFGFEFVEHILEDYGVRLEVPINLNSRVHRRNLSLI